jgi:pimeloyl-ACP methyl ester carboxylesterase
MATGFHSIREECAIRGGRRAILDFRRAGERLAGILLAPDGPGPCPAALLLHGFTLDKERMAESAGIALLGRGVASLSIDLPLHGERYQVVDLNAIGSPFALIRRWRAALDEASAALAYLASRDEIDPARLALVGYSLGAYLGLKVASQEPSVRALVVAAAGDIPDYVPFAGMVRAIADPLELVRKLAGRPLLVAHGRHDRTIAPEQAERLFRAAR